MTPKERLEHYKKTVPMGRFQKYGLTEDDYKELLVKQDHTCDICDGLSSNGQALSVDHNHDTGFVRGLLCHNCNCTLGMSGDSIDRLKKCAKYLKKRGTYGKE